MDPGVPEELVGDAKRLRQILLNLVNNAVKFTLEGDIRIHMNLRESEGDHVILSCDVVDTGIGIEPELVEEIFNPFCQAESTLNRKFEGTGLGLAICKQLVSLLGGGISLKSELDQGSTFTFWVKLKKTEKSKAFRMACPAQNTELLIVGGSPGQRDVLLDMLTSKAVQCSTCSNMDEGFSMLDRNPNIGTVILDTHGILSKLEYIKRRIWASSRNLNRNILLITDSMKSGAKGMIPGGDRCRVVSKPISQFSLSRKLEELWAPRRQPVSSMKTRPVFPVETPKKAEPQLSKDISLLVAEDNKNNQVVILELLRRLGFSADVVESGSEVLEVLAKKHYDAILMDIYMPRLDGIEATRRIRANFPPKKQPKIIAVTASVHAIDRENCINAGMDGFITKPISLKQLKSALELVTSES